MSSAKKSNPGLWKRIVAAVKAGTKGGNAGQWSARKAQLMSSRGKEAFPTVFPKEKDTQSHDPKDWLDMPNTEEAYNEAKKRGEVVKFATKRRAAKIAMGAWKEKEDNPFKGEFKKEAKANLKKELKEIRKNGTR